MSKPRIVIVGTNFAGYTAALELVRLLGERVRVTVVARTHVFTFIPSLIWVPFGLRTEEDITFDVRPVYAEHGVEFIEDTVEGFDLDERRVVASREPIPYDYLVVATGPKADFSSIPGISPDANNHSILNYADASDTARAWTRFLADPGPAVVGATQGAACFGAAYEFMLNMRYQLAKHHVADRARLTFVTAEPFLSHFGIGGFGMGRAMCEKLFKLYDIDWRTDAIVESVEPDAVMLPGERIESRFTMLIPRFTGVDAVRNTPGLANEAGFIEVDDTYQHPDRPEVFAAGVAVHVAPPGETPVACGVPKTGYPSEQMAKTAAHNIQALIEGRSDLKRLAFSDIKALCVMDTGNMGMMILGDHMLSPRGHEAIIPGPQAHWAKVGFEKYYLATRRRGFV